MNDPRYVEYLKQKQDEFAENYATCPMKVRGQHLEDVEDLHSLYKQHLLEATCLEDMKNVAKEWGFFTTKTLTTLLNMTDYDYEVIRHILLKGKDIYMDDYIVKRYSHVILPQYMLFAKLITEKYALPEYYAATQYVMGIFNREIDKYSQA